MSIPSNPLDKSNTYRILTVLAAFKYTDWAEESTLPLDKNLGRGDSVGKEGIIIVNDAKPTETQIISMKHVYDWNSVHLNNTLSMGELMIVDRNATSLLTFLKNEVVSKLETSVENLTFALRMFFITNKDAPGGGSIEEVISTEHFYFSVPNIMHHSSGVNNYYTLPMLALYNTKLQLDHFYNLQDITITHESGDLHETVPEPEPVVATILPRGVEDALKTYPRIFRMEKSKPMLNLQDVADALEKDLKARNEIHKSQLQKWQAVIRSDFEDKLERDPEQIKEIPIDYHISLGDGYGGYEIDNRHLLFEQPEQDQTQPGIRAIPTKPSESLSSVIDRIMSLSKATGEDAEKGKLYKMATAWRRMHTGIMKYNIVINQFDIPMNNPDGNDTGPGESAVGDGLTFVYMGRDESDIITLSGKTSRPDSLSIVESNAESEEGRVSISADREGLTAEREISAEFYASGFSGIRSRLYSLKSLGAEYPVDLENLLLANTTNQQIQDSSMVIDIIGNPNLFSDLMRKAGDVADGNEGDRVHYYKFIEKHPIYAKLIIPYVIKGAEESLKPEEEDDLPTKFHHEETYMHVKKIETILESGMLIQRLHLLRTDRII